MLAVYLLGRSYTTDVVALMGWSAAVLLMPAILTQMRTSMIDVQAALFLIAALHYATRPNLRLHDVIVATLAMALLMGSKSTALAWIPPLAMVAYDRLLFARRGERMRASIAVVLLGSASIAGIAALTFLRNYLAFKNPLWPVSFASPLLHIDWRGLVTLDDISPSLPLRELIARKVGLGTGDVESLIVHDYGHAVPWIVVPVSVVALGGAAFVALRARVRRQRDRETESLLLLATLGAAFITTSPSLNVARYNVQIVAIAVACIAWAAGRMRGLAWIHGGAMAATLLLAIVPTLRTGWSFGVTGQQLVALHAASAKERAAMNTQAFQMPPDVARARERDLGAGDLVVFGREIEFPGVLWNHAMSNRVEYIDAGGVQGFLAQVERRRPKWVVVGVASPARAALAKMTAEWELVGTAAQKDRTVVFRRRAPWFSNSTPVATAGRTGSGA